MRGEIRELDIYDLSRPSAGGVAPWVRLVVVLACAATLVVLAAGPRLVWSRDAHTISLPTFWFHNAFALAFTLTLVAVWLPGSQGSRYVRFAVVVPILQVAAMVVMWIAWQLLRAQLPAAVDSTPLLAKLPVSIVVVGLAVAIGGCARVVARRRRREWLHAVVMLALVDLLLLGLWLPLASATWAGESLGWAAWIALEDAVAHPAAMIAYILVPPLAAATVFTATALRWPQVWRRNAPIVGVTLLIAVAIAIAYRRDLTDTSAFVYMNFIHVLASTALVAGAALAALGLVMWVGNARGRRMLAGARTIHGVIAGHGDLPVATLELTSWLRGPHPTSRAFSVVTSQGEVPLPPNVRIVTATPLATTVLRHGESVATLRRGDRVTLAGFVAGGGDGPFRETTAPIAGEAGIWVGRRDDERYGFAHVTLDLWRPSIAFLLILVTVALPGLAALAH